jgi:hypothetical protein
MFGSTSEATPVFERPRRHGAVAPLTSRSESSESEHSPASSPLIVAITVEKCTNLKSAGIAGTSAFVLIYQSSMDKEDGKTTKVVKRSQNPVYNETLFFYVERSSPFITGFRIEVIDDGMLKKVVGSADLSLNNIMEKIQMNGEQLSLELPLIGGQFATISLTVKITGRTKGEQ